MPGSPRTVATTQLRWSIAEWRADRSRPSSALLPTKGVADARRTTAPDATPMSRSAGTGSRLPRKTRGSAAWVVSASRPRVAVFESITISPGSAVWASRCTNQRTAPLSSGLAPAETTRAGPVATAMRHSSPRSRASAAPRRATASRTASAERAARATSSSCTAGAPNPPRSSPPATRGARPPCEVALVAGGAPEPPLYPAAGQPLDRPAVIFHRHAQLVCQTVEHALERVTIPAERADLGEEHGDRLLALHGWGSRAQRRLVLNLSQPRVLAQDRLLELTQRRARLDPELVDEYAARVLVEAERVGLAP